MQTKSIELRKITVNITGLKANSKLKRDQTEPDQVVIEEPLHVHLRSYIAQLSKEANTQAHKYSVVADTTKSLQLTTVITPVMTTMRTPGQDLPLVKGWLNTQRFIHPSDIAGIRSESNNLVVISAHKHFRLDTSQLTRIQAATSSCGICGDTEIDQLIDNIDFTPLTTVTINHQVLQQCVTQAFSNAKLFELTGGAHSSAAFAIEKGALTNKLIAIHEDVGRHNALDKVVGSTQAKLLQSAALVLSGRVSADLMQKVACAKIPLLISIGAPSSLAVDMAQSLGIVLIGFVKRDSFNIYSGQDSVNINNDEQASV